MHFACGPASVSEPPQESTFRFQDESFYSDSLLSANYLRNLSDSAILVLLDQIESHRPAYQKDSVLLKMANALSVISPDYNRDPVRARRYLETMLRLRRNYHGNNSDYDIARNLLFLGLSYKNTGELTLALEFLKEAEHASRNFQLHPMLAIQASQAEVHAQLNDTEIASRKFDLIFEKLDSFDRISDSLDPGKWNIVKFKISTFTDPKSELENNLGHYYQSLETVFRGMALVEKNLEEFKDFDIQYLRISEGVAWLDSAKSLGKTNPCPACLQKSIAAFSSALQYFRDKRESALFVQSCINLGSAYERTGEYEKATGILQAGIDTFLRNRSSLDATMFTQLQLNLGTNLYRLNRSSEALAAYDKALYGPEQKANPTLVLPPVSAYSRDYQTSLVLLGSIGRVRLRQSHTDPDMRVLANAAYDTLFSLINYMRSNLTDDRAKLRLAERSQEWLPDAFADITELYRSSGNPYYLEKAFQISEQGKAFSLLEASRLKNATGLLPADLQKMQEDILDTERRAVGHDSLREQVQKLKLEFLSRLKKEAPSYFALKYRGPELNTGQIRSELLDSNQAMLSYFLEDSVLNVFLLSRDSFSLDTIRITKNQIQALVRQFRANLNPVQADGTIDPNRVQDFLQASHELYRHLIGHTAGHYPLSERLIIIPDGALSDLSFDALLVHRNPDQNDLPALVRNKNFLVQNHMISYCFSAGLLQEMKRRNGNSSLSLQLALFAPRFDPGSPVLPFMKNQEREIQAIKDRVSDAISPEQGTKEAFLAATRKNAYLHLCAHGFVSGIPDSSFIAFRQNSAAADSSQFFYLSELYHHRLDQELITLTACETALGEHRSGEGNISLARGFAYAGVKSFITTLWKIQTEGAARIIPTFYDHFLNKNLPKDVALTLSKRAYLEEGKGVYPENWAGMILIGNTAAVDAMAVADSSPVWIWIPGLIILAGLGAWWIKRQRKR